MPPKKPRSRSPETKDKIEESKQRSLWYETIAERTGETPKRGKARIKQLEKMVGDAQDDEERAERTNIMLQRMIQLLRHQNQRLVHRLQEHKITVPPADLSGLPIKFSLSQLSTSLNPPQISHPDLMSQRIQMDRFRTMYHTANQGLNRYKRLYRACKKLNTEMRGLNQQLRDRIQTLERSKTKYIRINA